MRLIHELKRRHVFRVATGYIALSWLAIQIAETVLPAFGLGDGVRIVVLVAVIGFIPVLAFAWVFELTPEGFKRDREVDRDSEAVRKLDKRLDRLAIVILALAVGYFAFDKFVLDPARDEAFRKALLGQAAGRDDSASRLGDAVLVTDFPGSHTQPTLSPDGRRMAFVSPDGNSVTQIWVMSLPDGEPVQITRGELPATSPSWSPVDDNILFQRASDEEGQGIWLVDAQGTRTPRLLVPRGWSPRFAPDGRSFVFVPRPRKIATGYLDGTEPRPLEGIPQTPGFAEPMPAMNASGDVVFVLADESPIGDLWLFEAASGAFRQITTSVNEWPGVGAEGPVWLPDGRTVMYAAPDGGFTNYHLWQIDTSGGDPVMLTAGSGGYGSPAVSGDGSSLAYAHSRPVSRLVATDPVTGQDRVLYQTRNPIALPLVSPGGESVVYFAEDGVFTVPVAGGKAEQRTFGPTAAATLPTWSRSDGSIWYYKGRSLHRLDPETGLSQEPGRFSLVEAELAGRPRGPDRLQPERLPARRGAGPLLRREAFPGAPHAAGRLVPGREPPSRPRPRQRRPHDLLGAGTGVRADPGRQRFAGCRRHSPLVHGRVPCFLSGRQPYQARLCRNLERSGGGRRAPAGSRGWPLRALGHALWRRRRRRHRLERVRARRDLRDLDD